MSYNVYTPCYQCAKKINCRDAQRLQDGVNKLHNDGIDGTHLGGGQISLMCVRMVNAVDMALLQQQEKEKENI